MGKRLRGSTSIRCCVSPCSSSSTSFHSSSHSFFACYEEDLWIEIAKCLDGKSIIMLAAKCCWFKRIMMEECVWKFVCLRDLQVLEPHKVAFKWNKLYAATFDGSHSFMFHQQDKHIEAFLTEKLICPTKLIRNEKLEKVLQSFGFCVLSNIKNGIWIADLQLVQCPACDQDTCDGTMQVVEARHIELFLSEEYQNGSWEYEQIGHRDIKKHADGASGGIFDTKHLKDVATSELFNLKSWVGKPNDWQPRAIITLNAVAVNTNLQQNEGLHIKYHVMRAGPNGEIVSIRISQQLI